MWTQIVGWIMKSKAAKAGGATLGTGGIVALLFGLHTDITGKVEKAEARNKEYVELRLKPLEDKVNDTNQKVNKLYEHLLKPNNK